MKKTLALVGCVFSGTVLAESMKPNLTYAVAGSGYEYIQLGVKLPAKKTGQGLIYLSQKSVETDFLMLEDKDFKTTRLGVEVTSIEDRHGMGNIYLYSDESIYKYYERQGLGFGLGVSGGDARLNPYAYGEINFEMFSTDWDKVPLTYNLQAGIDYSFNRNVTLGVFLEHQGFSDKELFNENYSVLGLSVGISM